ncbi:MAG: DUF1800 domain-containing protein [Oceanicaulis sp.]
MSAMDASVAVTRFGLGARPGEIDLVRRAPRDWLAAQIGRAEPLTGLPRSDAILRDFQQNYRPLTARLRQGGGDAEDVQREIRAMIREPRAAHVAARTTLAVQTGAGFSERWVRFWSNHFTVASNSLQSALVAPTLEAEAVRPLAFASFAELLLACELHPAMLIYLDQAVSVGPNSPAGRRRDLGLNENLAREILELHTLGSDGGYSQVDVEALARILTGWTVGSRRLRVSDDQIGRTVFSDLLQEPGAHTLLGRRFAGDGPERARDALLHVAGMEQTARFVCLKIARHFISDVPDRRDVDHLVTAWRRSGGDLAAVAGALITAPSAFDPGFGKFKTPEDFLISSLRALDAADLAPRQLYSAYSSLGQAPFSAPSPAGWPDTEADWAGPDAVLKRLDFASSLAERAGPRSAPRERAEAVLGARLGEETRQAIARAQTAEQGLTLLFMSPEFQRR